MISLEALLKQIPQEDYPCQSRIHPLPLLSCAERSWFIKREDELGFFTSGSKIRKWRTLIPALTLRGVEKAIVIGSAQSNNVLGLSLLLLEKGIKPLPLLLQSHDPVSRGNHLFTQLSARDIMYLKREEWPRVEAIAASLKDDRTAIIPEGSYMPEAFFGALTLAQDIARNENESGLSFDHIFIDAGTGLQAAALIIGLALLGHKALISVLLIHENEEKFKGELLKWQALVPSGKLNYRCFTPKGERGFKPLSSLKPIVDFARETGVWTDPLYSGRLIRESVVQAENMQGTIILIHSGGLSSLMGFQEELKKWI